MLNQIEGKGVVVAGATQSTGLDIIRGVVVAFA